jgi:hypothetical protein
MGTASDYGAPDDSFAERLFTITGARWPFLLALAVITAALFAQAVL